MFSSTKPFLFPLAYGSLVISVEESVVGWPKTQTKKERKMKPEAGVIGLQEIPEYGADDC